MFVYVDQFVSYPPGTVKGEPRAKYWCHMWADSIEELHEFAAEIGMKRYWFQGPPIHKFPHYDLTKQRRAIAVKAGAIEVEEITREILIKMIKLGEEIA